MRSAPAACSLTDGKIALDSGLIARFDPILSARFAKSEWHRAIFEKPTKSSGGILVVQIQSD